MNKTHSPYVTKLLSALADTPKIECDPLDTILSDLFLKGSKPEAINVLTGVGKTRAIIHKLMTCYKTDDFKATYAANTVLELVEAYLRSIREIRAGNKDLKLHEAVTRFHKFVKLEFGFYGKKREDLKKVEAIFKSSDWTDPEKQLVRNLVCRPKHSITDMDKVVYTSHEAIKRHSGLHHGRDVIFDEVPAWFFELVSVQKHVRAASLLVFHDINVTCISCVHVDPSAISSAVYNGLIKIRDISAGTVAYHFNPTTSFRTCSIFTAYAEADALAKITSLLGDVITFTKMANHSELVAKAKEDFELRTLDKLTVTNKDTADIRAEMDPMVDNPALTFEICTAPQGTGNDGIIVITTNKKGTNSYSQYKGVKVMTQLNLGNKERAMYKAAFGEVRGLELERLEAGARLLQSIYRSAIRKGEKIVIYCCSEECKLRILMALES